MIALFVACTMGLSSGDGVSRLAVIRNAPEIRLQTQDGKPFQLSRERDKVWLVSFIFTTCNGSCPATTSRLATLQSTLVRDHPKLVSQVGFLSVTLDPARDTSAVLKQYMKVYDINPLGWRFLTGSIDAVQGVVTAWGMWAKPMENGQLDHPSRVFLVDKKGRIREIYNLDFLKPTWVVEDLALLVGESS